jgi:hypothetical protein
MSTTRQSHSRLVRVPWPSVAVQTIVPAAIAGLFFLRHATTLGCCAATLSGWMLLSGLFLPRAFLAVEGALKTFGRWVGIALTWVLLVLFFFLCFVPLSWLVRRQARHLLALEFDKNAPSYWQDRKPPGDPEHFLRQY